MAVLVKRGHRGPQVSDIQKRLNLARTKRPSQYPPLVEDGIFGQNTGARVREFQAMNNLMVDGIVGPNTWHVLTGGTVTPPAPAPQPTPTTRKSVRAILAMNNGQFAAFNGSGRVVGHGDDLGSALDDLIDALAAENATLSKLTIVGTRRLTDPVFPGTGYTALMQELPRFRKLKKFTNGAGDLQLIAPCPAALAIQVNFVAFDAWVGRNRGLVSFPSPGPLLCPSCGEARTLGDIASATGMITTLSFGVSSMVHTGSTLEVLSVSGSAPLVKGAQSLMASKNSQHIGAFAVSAMNGIV